MPEDGNRFRVGYALPERKLQCFMVQSFIDYAKNRGVDFVPIDLSKPLPPFDCVIHKLYGHDWNLNLRDFSLHNPNAVVIDPPSAIERLHHRITMLDCVVQLKIPKLSIPNQLLVSDSTSLILDTKLEFPVIAKPVVADGSTKSHNMSLVFNREGLAKLGLESEASFVLQQFVNHGGVIFKVYVADEYVECVKRSSLPDISKETFEKMSLESGGVLCFSQISNSAMAVEDGRNCNDSGEDVKMPAAEFVAEVAKGLREALGLHLFNFDMIRDHKGDGYLVIDINYFPGYEKLPRYETIMTDFFLKIMKSQRLNGEEKEKEDDDDQSRS